MEKKKRNKTFLRQKKKPFEIFVQFGNFSFIQCSDRGETTIFQEIINKSRVENDGSKKIIIIQYRRQSAKKKSGGGGFM